MEIPVTGEEEKPKQSIVELFDEACPHYLAMGMTWEQFWEKDCTMVIPYRKAWKIRQEQENRMAWLQGMYIYDALCAVSPVLHAFAKSGTRPHPYHEKPYEFESPKKTKKEDTNRKKTENTVNYMQNLMLRFNQSNAERKRKQKPAGKEVNSDV